MKSLKNYYLYIFQIITDFVWVLSLQINGSLAKMTRRKEIKCDV